MRPSDHAPKFQIGDTVKVKYEFVPGIIKCLDTPVGRSAPSWGTAPSHSSSHNSRLGIFYT
jgi:hypothetical protein